MPNKCRGFRAGHGVRASSRWLKPVASVAIPNTRMDLEPVMAFVPLVAVLGSGERAPLAPE